MDGTKRTMTGYHSVFRMIVRMTIRYMRLRMKMMTNIKRRMAIDKPSDRQQIKDKDRRVMTTTTLDTHLNNKHTVLQKGCDSEVAKYGARSRSKGPGARSSAKRRATTMTMTTSIMTRMTPTITTTTTTRMKMTIKMTLAITA